MEFLDSQMRKWSSRLRDDLEISPYQSQKLATSIEAETLMLSGQVKDNIRNSSPISPETRLEELIAFQSWMDFASSQRSNPAVVRAQVITQNYICFVYLKETWFEVLSQYLSVTSTTSKCCKFLLSNPIRFFRNAISHGNWCYRDDFSGIDYWDRKDRASTYNYFSVEDYELEFWQALSRATAYASFLGLR